MYDTFELSHCLSNLINKNIPTDSNGIVLGASSK